MDKLMQQLQEIDIKLKAYRKREKKIGWQKYKELYHKSHVRLIQKKWKIRQLIFEQLNEDQFKNPKNFITKGVYCYGCPFWDTEDDYDRHMNGYCYYVKIGDWDAWNFIEDKLDYLSLIWDECKICNVNHGLYCDMCEKEIAHDRNNSFCSDKCEDEFNKKI